MTVSTIEFPLGLYLRSVNLIRQEMKAKCLVEYSTRQCLAKKLGSPQNLHKTGTTLCIIAETAEGLTSNINANVSMHVYFLSHINVINTLLTEFSLHPLIRCLLLPLLFNRGKRLDILLVMSSNVSGCSPLFNQNRYL